MNKTMMIAVAALCCWTSLSAEEFHYVSFKTLAKEHSETPKVQAKPVPKPAEPEHEHPHWPVYTTESIHAACRHLGNIGMRDESTCAVYCHVPREANGFYNISEFSDYFYYECYGMISLKPISETEVEETTCSGKAVVSKLTNEVVASADVGRRGRPDVRTSDEKPTCSTARHAPVPEMPAPIPF